MSKRQHEVFSQANSGRRMPQVASTGVDFDVMMFVIHTSVIEVRAILLSPYCTERGIPLATMLSLFACFTDMLLFPLADLSQVSRCS